MLLRIRWSRPSLRRLDEIGTYISAENPEAASRVVTRIMSCAERLAEFPELVRIGRVPNTRELPVLPFPYLLVYRNSAETIDIVTIIHGARLWPPRQP